MFRMSKSGKRKRQERAKEIARRGAKKAEGIPWAKPVPLSWLKSIVHDPDISHRELAVIMHGLLSANKNDGERIWHRAETEAKATGVGTCNGKNAGKDVSRVRTQLCMRGL